MRWTGLAPAADRDRSGTYACPEEASRQDPPIWGLVPLPLAMMGGRMIPPFVRFLAVREAGPQATVRPTGGLAGPPNAGAPVMRAAGHAVERPPSHPSRMSRGRPAGIFKPGGEPVRAHHERRADRRRA